MRPGIPYAAIKIQTRIAAFRHDWCVAFLANALTIRILHTPLLASLIPTARAPHQLINLELSHFNQGIYFIVIQANPKEPHLCIALPSKVSQ